MEEQKNITNLLKIAGGVLMFTLFANYLSAASWQPPTQDPPLQDDFLAPLNEGSDLQQKTGVLVVGGMAVSDGGRLAIPAESVPEGLAANILLWLGGVAQANDFCLQNGTTCLSTAGSASGKLIFSGYSSISNISSGSTYRCHPSGGSCQNITTNNGDYMGITVPFAVTLRNFTVTPSEPYSNSSAVCTFKLVKKTGTCTSAATFDTSSTLSCALNGGTDTICTNTTSTLSVAANQCFQVYVSSSGAICNSNPVTWSFEADY
jgi:hypothetical protein